MSTTKSPQQILGVLIKKVFLSYILSTASSTPSSSYSSDNISNNNSNCISIPKLSDLTAPRLNNKPEAESSLSSQTVDPYSNSSSNSNTSSSKSNRAVMLVSIQPCFDKKLEASRLVRADRDHSDNIYV